MKKIIHISFWCLLLCLTGSLQAQQLTSAEYFFDTDPGVGNGTPIAVGAAADSLNVNFTAPFNALSSGFHYLYVRFEDANGIWGLYQPASFYVVTSAVYNDSTSPQISAAEYFIDTDPGLGNGTPFAVSTADSVNAAFNVPLNSLSTGFHHLYVRFQYTNGLWGNYDGRAFYVIPLADIDTSPQINYAEYFFDNDPGVGNGTPVSINPAADSVSVAINANDAGLAYGQHRFYLRFRYTDGTWGLYMGGDSASFSVCNGPLDTIVAAGPTTFCIGGSVALTGDTSSLWHYQWLRNGNSLPGDTFSNLQATTTGVYDVVITADTGNCPATSNTISVTVNGAITNLFDTICSGSSFTFNGQNLDTTGTYRDTIPTGSCDSIVTLQLTVNPVPVVSLSWGPSVATEQLQITLNGDTGDCGDVIHNVAFTGGTPPGGTYTGFGVFDNTLYFDSLLAHNSVLWDTITYTFSLDGCGASASDILATPSNGLCSGGVTQLSLEQSISLYPNPASDVLMVQSALFTTNMVTPVLYDITGKVIASAGFSRDKDQLIFNTTSLSAGVYFIKLDINGTQAVKQFVKVE